MDPSRSSDPVPVSALHALLRYIARHLSSTDHTVFLSPSSPRDIAIRCAMNIINFAQSNDLISGPIDPVSALYAAHWALFLLPNNVINFRQNLAVLMQLIEEKFPHDATLIEKYIIPNIGHRWSEEMQLSRRVRLMEQSCFHGMKRRDGNPDADGVKFRVGQVFRHKRYDYTAVVTGWDAKCAADEEWIEYMGVASLNGGRGQAFYQAL